MLPGQGGRAQRLLELQKRRGGAAAQAVYPREPFPDRVVEVGAPAVGVHAPVRGLVPAAVAYVPGEAVVFKLVALLAVEPGEARAQEGEDLRGLPAAGRRAVGRGDERRQGFFGGVGPRGREERHAEALKGRLERGAVVLKAARGHGDIPPAAARARQAQRLGRGEFALRRHIPRGEEAYPPLRVEAARRIGQQVLRKRVHGRALGRLHGLDARGYALLAGMAQEIPRRGAREVEELAAVVHAVQREAERHVRAVHELAYDALLLRGEVREAVYIHLAVPGEAAVRQARGEQAEPVGGIRPAGADRGLKALAYEREVAQLVPERARQRHCGGLQLLRAVLGGRQLVHGGKELKLQLRRAARAGVHAQAAVHGLERERHAQQPPARRQRLFAAGAELGLHPPGNAREAQHLGVQRRARPGNVRQLAFGLVAVLLRHEQDAAGPAGLDALAQLVHYSRGLAGARAAGYDSEHGLPRKIPIKLLYRKEPRPASLQTGGAYAKILSSCPRPVRGAKF